MTRTIRDMSRTEIDEFLSGHQVGLLSMSCDDKPYAIPLAYAYDGESVYLSLGPGGRKGDCIQKNRSVCFVVHTSGEQKGAEKRPWKSVVCEGEIGQLTQRRGIEKAVRAFEKQLGLPCGTWDDKIARVSATPEKSHYFGIAITQLSGKTPEIG